MDQFYIVLNQIGVFFILIVAGVICVKVRLLNAESLVTVSRLVMKVALPALIFVNTADGATRQGLFESLLVVPIAAAGYVVLYLLAALIVRLFRLTGDRARVFRAILMFGNVGFMGIPLVAALYPDSAMLYISLYTIVDQGLFWTYGVSLTKPAPRGGERKEPFSLKGLKNLLSPALAAILLATALVLAGIRLPRVVVSALDKLAGASMPMSLLYIGGMLAMTDVRKVLKCGELYAGIGLKMLVLPVAAFALMQLLGVPGDMAGTMTFLLGLPAINVVAMLAKTNGSDGEYAVCAVMLTTIACLLTLPLVSLGTALIG